MTHIREWAMIEDGLEQASQALGYLGLEMFYLHYETLQMSILLQRALIFESPLNPILHQLNDILSYRLKWILTTEFFQFPRESTTNFNIRVGIEAIHGTNHMFELLNGELETMLGE